MAISLTNEHLSLTSSGGISIKLTSSTISLTESQVPVGSILYWQRYNDTNSYNWVTYKVPSFGTWLVMQAGADHSILSSGATIASKYSFEYMTAVLIRGE